LQPEEIYVNFHLWLIFRQDYWIMRADCLETEGDSRFSDELVDVNNRTTELMEINLNV
jgi:hypothetical protein